MTVSQLYNSVAQLGFEDSLEEDSRFIFAVNRALLQVNALRPVTKAFVINHNPLENKIKGMDFKPIERKQELIYYANGVKSYYFEAEGIGRLIIEHLEADEWNTIGEQIIDSPIGFTQYRGFIKKDGNFINDNVRMRFTGDYIYTIRSVAMYEYIYSENAKDIPAFAPFSRYDISDLAKDFLTLSTPPIVEAEGGLYLNQDYAIENGRVILLPREKSGVYKVVYNKKPQYIKREQSVSEDMTAIELDEDLCSLLPTLVASYIWLEDEPQKAEYYLALYREGAANIASRVRNVTSIPIISTNGW
jgi:hypothetical protein